MFKSLKGKLMFFIGIAVFISFSFTVAFVSMKTTSVSKEQSFEETKSISREHANYISKEIEKAMTSTRTIAEVFKTLKGTENRERDDFNKVLKNFLEDNEDYLGIWTVWEANALDGKDELFKNKVGHDKTGRFIPYWNRAHGKVSLTNLEDYDVEGAGDYYLLAKNTKSEIILDPYYYSVNGKEVLVSSVVVPIVYNEKVIGAVGIDITLDTFQELISGIKPFNTGYVALISNNGVYVAHKDEDHLGKDIGNTEERIKAKKAIKEGKSHDTIIQSNSTKKKVYRHFTPVSIGNCETPWSLAVSVPMDTILESGIEMRNYGALIGFVSLISVLIIIYIIASRIVKNINKTVDMLKDISQGEGDLTKRLKILSKDEIGELSNHFNLFVDKIQELVHKIKEDSEYLSESTGNIAVTIDQMNQGIEEMAVGISSLSDSSQNNASVVEETSASVQELANASEIISQQSNDAVQSSDTALDSINKGKLSVSKVVDANKKVKKSTEEVYQAITELKDSSDKVGMIVSVITGIAEQTNLLALNAAIEAARAGENGKGFSVVADEVRKLAEESKESAMNIKKLIEEIQTRAEHANSSITDGQKLVQESVERSNDIDEQFNYILESIEGINEKIKMISDSSNQQSVVSEEISKAMDEVSATTQEDASSVQQINAVIEEQASSFEEIANKIGELSSMADGLKKQTDRFKVD